MFAAEGEQLAGQRRSPRRGSADFANVLRNFSLHLQLVEEEIAVAENGGEKIIEVVGNAAGELAERFHLLRANELVLKLFARRDVHQRTDELQRPAERIADDAG